tara:strand:- start:1267 stop:1725 length:459 start_codon:yes stop_codon:yes gene_type:complete
VKLYRIKKSKIDKNGLYANRDIKQGTRIIEYKGKIISNRQSEEDSKFDNDKAIYLFNINKKYDLDGDFKFNTARLINHSCDPNCEVFGSGLKVWVYAMKNIKKGEELSYDYGFNYDKDYKNFPCKCGSKKCAGYIVREGSRWRIKKIKRRKN